jgi:phage gp37-like protein
MSLIGTIEDQVCDLVRAHFTNRLKAVESLPADWDNDTFKRILRQAPGVFVVYGGGPMRDLGNGAQNQARLSLIVATTHASGEKARRRGDSREIGAYEIVENLIALLHNKTLPAGTTLTASSVENLFTGQLETQGAAIYAVAFSLPLVFDTTGGPPNDLDAFETFVGDIDLAPADGTADVTAHVELEQTP